MSDSDNKLVIAMRAIPGSGKSTFAKQISQKAEQEGKKVLMLSADKYFYDLGGGTYKFDFRLLPQAHGSCFKQFIEALQEGVYDIVIIDNTNLRSMELSPYKLGADAYGYGFVIKEVLADREEAFKRNQHGVSEFGHRNMHNVMVNESLPPWWGKEKYRSKSTDAGPEFEKVEPNTPEEEKELTDKYSNQLRFEFKKAIAAIKRN
jgi:predicted kinase